MITIKKSTLIIISIIIIIILSLSISFNAKAASSSTTINSHGRLELNNSSGGTIVLDAQDIQDNANNIEQLNNNLTTLENIVSNTLGFCDITNASNINLPYTASENCYIAIRFGGSANLNYECQIDNNTLWGYWSSANNDYGNLVPLKAGQTISLTGGATRWVYCLKIPMIYN